MTDLRDGELGVCVVGAGDIGNVYLNSWRNTEGGTVVSLADVDVERAEKAAREYGAESWHTNYKEAVAAENVDIVTVCAPTMLHPEMTIHAAEQGKHVLCVKPIALALEDADRMIEVAERSGVKLCVGFMRRFTPTTALVRRMLSSGRIGRPVLYKVDVANGIRPKILMHAKHANGGPIIDMCCHYFDVARVYFGSEPVRVMAQGMVFAEGRTELAGIGDLAVDTGAIIVAYASGDILAVNISWGLPPNQDWTGGEEIWGPGGRVTGLGFDPARICVQTETTSETITIEKDGTFQDSTDLLVRDFLDSVRGDGPVSVTGEDGRRALEVSLAALESIEAGEAVDLA